MDLSEASELSPEIMVEFFNSHTLLESLVLSPIPEQCLRLFSTSTTTTINQSDQFSGFVKKDYNKTRKRAQEMEEFCKNEGTSSNKATKKADLQSIFNAMEKLEALTSLSLAYIGYSAQFLSMKGLGLSNLRVLNIKVPF